MRMADGLSGLQMIAIQPIWVLTSVLNKFFIKQLLVRGVLKHLHSVDTHLTVPRRLCV